MTSLPSKLQRASFENNFSLLSSLLWIPYSKSCVNIDVRDIIRDHLNSSHYNSSSIPNHIPHFSLITAHLKLLEFLKVPSFQNLKEAVNILQEMLSTLLKECSANEVPLLKRICSNYYYLCIYADKHNENTSGCREEAARNISKAFTLSLTDRNLPALSKKSASLALVNILFRLYFSLGTIRLCNNIVRALDKNIEVGEFPSFGSFPKSEVATYYYFRARIAINENQLKVAEQFMENVLKLVSRNVRFAPQKRQVLIYLIPIKMIHGCLPRNELLQEYQLVEIFGSLSEAVKKGNLHLFEETIRINQSFFMQKELYLILQLHLRNLVLRSLFKRAYREGLAKNLQQENRLNLSVVQAAFSACNEQVERDEIECIAANLIYNGFVKGYISHEKGIIVLSKTSAFPPPSTFL